MFLDTPGAVERYLGDTAQARTALHQAQFEKKIAPEIVALEPVDSAIPQEQFYLLPIFDSKESFDDNGQPVLIGVQ